MKWYQKLLSWITLGAVKIVAPEVTSVALEFVNDPQNQAVALNAARAAVARGFNGEKAWTFARDAMLEQFGNSAVEIASNWLDTLLQNAYFALANPEEK